MKYDLEDRTRKFSKDILKYYKIQKITTINENIIKQVLRSATSVGANYCEANGAISKTDFRAKIFVCKKEIKETEYWLDLWRETQDKEDIKISELIEECSQLKLIFSKIASGLKI